MATLVLTVAGGLVGGPVGAAIGAALGQQVDAAIFRPKGREGPRLADLQVQMSSYGQQIPQIFGTMRVAGSVIWATGLIERRNRTSQGKGRPSQTDYSYSISFAVALSSRPIRAIRRIWADGNLLRGASGVFQERCQFRYYDGGEDQAIDPLIASALGPASATGFRGLAYAMFEELELARFGNRIPSLTFEVEADDGAVDSGSIGDAVLDDAGRCMGHWPIGGYAAAGDRAADALQPLFETDRMRLVSASSGWRLESMAVASPAVRQADFSEVRRIASTYDCIERRRAPLSAAPGQIRVRHYEPGRDYQLGQQTSRVADGGLREERIDLPAVLSASSARALAHQLAADRVDGRDTCVWQADLAALALPVGGIISQADGSRWRLVSRTVRGDAVRIELRRHQPLELAGLTADAGESASAPDWPDAVGIVRIVDLPNLGAAGAAAPQWLIVGAGNNDGWRGADIWWAATPGAAPTALGRVRPAAALGLLTHSLPRGSASLFDPVNVATVRLANPSMTLESVSDDQLLAGANRAMVGDELIQFGRAEEVEPGLWRLSHLLRARAGTARADGHAVDTPFVVLEAAAGLMVPDALAHAAIGGAAKLQWAPRHNMVMHEVAVPETAMALRPLAPVHARVAIDDAGAATITWIGCSRGDGGWRDHGDGLSGESREAWRVTLYPAVAGVAAWDCPAPRLLIEATTMALVPPGHKVAICRVGDFALSAPLYLSLT